jgi:hypothetical protein
MTLFSPSASVCAPFLRENALKVGRSQDVMD